MSETFLILSPLTRESLSKVTRSWRALSKSAMYLLARLAGSSMPEVILEMSPCREELEVLENFAPVCSGVLDRYGSSLGVAEFGWSVGKNLEGVLPRSESSYSAHSVCESLSAKLL